MTTTTTTTNGTTNTTGNTAAGKPGAGAAFAQGKEKAVAFAKARPAATAALAGVIGLALLNTLRGR